MLIKLFVSNNMMALLALACTCVIRFPEWDLLSPSTWEHPSQQPYRTFPAGRNKGRVSGCKFWQLHAAFQADTKNIFPFK